ncbi:threonine-phosphate decarboxylase CobD [Chlorogloeopsis fritschii PCC 9212]|uniref:threonine-phosphate decarboxylase n=1 Tax=Chlorogloeopsis fritschii PCC 6912 TaxID=211165 RepID=A0A3S1AMH8_CHLFR|nr:threonine-phosphate decarboxylase CobD [Chlorogloeopsis fritschii]RUR84886.1 threonine-phosphate decarboxylase [Chlorogloeopsis fritschii PCC 6912]
MRQRAHGGNLAWASALAGCPPSAIVDFSASISPLGPPRSVLAAIESELANLRHYPDPDYRELRLALCHFHQLPLEWILPGNGSAELLTLAGRELAGLAATVLITPAFGDYYRSLSAYNAKVLEFPISLERQGKISTPIHGENSPLFPFPLNPITEKFPTPKLADIPQEATDRGGSPASVYPSKRHGLLLNNPHNPTGKLFSREAILPYLDEFGLVVVDEAFMDFLPACEEQSLIGVVQKYPNLVILRSLTKFYSLPGLRLGYAIAHPDRLQRWQSWRDPWPVNTLAQAAAIAAVSDREFQQQTWAWLPPARKQLFEGLAQITGLQPCKSAANFLLVSSQQSSCKLQEELLKHHQILIRDCLSFRELGDRYFRVAVRLSSENQRLLNAIALVNNL